MQDKQVAIVGGGVAGMQIASILGKFGYKVTLFEKENRLGGNVANWKHLFPYNQETVELIDELSSTIKQSNIAVELGKNINDIQVTDNQIVVTDGGNNQMFDAVVLTTGFEPFDATKKEEYGYGVFDRVVTSADFEKEQSNKHISEMLSATSGKVGFVHCVGSRDEKVCNEYCSKACCITAVKQAIEVKKRNPNLDVYCFYMDLRLFDRHFEKIYRKAQEEYGVQFIRGRVSEVSENESSKLVVRVEDTLSHRPMKLSLEMLVLMVGMVPSSGTRLLGKKMDLISDEDHFIAENTNVYIAQNSSAKGKLFVAGTAKGPLTVKETLADAKSVATNIHFSLNQVIPVK